MDTSFEMEVMFINKIKITHILPCIADPEKIRFIAYFDKNISEILPYLNGVLDGEIYNHLKASGYNVSNVFASDLTKKREVKNGN